MLKGLKVEELAALELCDESGKNIIPMSKYEFLN
jgi:hypothetical protein